MYSILSVKNLFFGKNQSEIMRANYLCNMDHVLPNVAKYSKHAIDLLQKLLQPDPQDRPTAEEALDHPWFASEQCAVNESLTINAMFTAGANQWSSSNLKPIGLGKQYGSILQMQMEPISISP